MNIGTILIWLSFILAIVVPLSFIFHKKFEKRYFRSISIIATILCICTMTLVYLLLTFYFLTSNFDIHYVWEHSSRDLDWYLKIAAVWSGKAGSLLIWVWLILIALGIEEFIQYYRRRKYAKSLNSGAKDDRAQELNSTKTFDWTRMIIMMVVLVFLILLIINEPFEPAHEFEDTIGAKINPADYPDGHGMNPELRNIWMVIHPPILFIGYALITIPFAASISYSITEDKKWTKISLQWSRLAWLFLTLGISLGALWAYVTSGWGGYWSWDPVEVSALVPWITLTAFLHTQIRFIRKNEYRIITPILGTITFVLIIFGTFITRSGLWSSVHAWWESDIGWILIATMAIIIFCSGLLILRFFIFTEKIKAKIVDDAGDIIDEDSENKNVKDPSQRNWDSQLMSGTIYIFIIMAILVFIGLIISMREINSAYYETRLAPFVIILLMVMSVCLCWRYLRKKMLIYILTGTTIVGIICAVVLPIYIFPGEAEQFYSEMISNHTIVGFIIPFVFLAIISAIIRMIKQFKLKTLRNSVKSLGPHIVHLGVAFIIIGYCVSNTMVTEESQTLQLGDKIDVGDYSIKFKEISIEENTNDANTTYGYWDTWRVTIEIYRNDEFLEKGELTIIYRAPGEHNIRRQLFKWNISFRINLTPGPVDDELKEVFEINQIYLANDARIIESDEKYWKISESHRLDLIRNYTIIENTQKNEIYIVEANNTHIIVYGEREYLRPISSEVFVSQIGLEDLYITSNIISYSEIEVQVLIIPFVSMLWVGLGLFVIGIVLRIIIYAFSVGKKQ